MATVSALNPREHYLAMYNHAAIHLPGARLPWLQSARSRALEQFSELGFPNNKQENWKYTSLASLTGRGFQPGMPQDARPDCRAAIAALQLPADAHVLVFINGHYSAADSTLHALPAGVMLCNLRAALDTQPQLLEPFLAHTSYATGLSALNTALFGDGYVLSLPERTEVEAAIHVLFLQTANESVANIKNVIIAEAGSRARVIEHFVGANELSYFNNISTDIVARHDAHIEHLKLQQESTTASHIAEIRTMQEYGSAFESYSFSLGGLLARNDIATKFAGERASCLMNGLYMTQGKQLVDHHTRVDHAMPRCTSREFYKGILDGSSRAVFNGKVIVHKDAQQTDAAQSNRNLLLSENAEIDTKPELEIYADDVKCAHGATIGQLDPAQIFYLRSRGIDEAAARILLTFAFAEDVIQSVKYLPLRQRLEHILVGRLPDAELLKEFL